MNRTHVALAAFTVFLSIQSIRAERPTTVPQDQIEVQVEIIEPEKLVGRSLPFIESLSDPDALASGEWLVVMFHHDCRLCRVEVPKYVTLARGGRRIAFIEIPPYAPPGTEVVSSDENWFFARLPDDRHWFVPMLTRFEVKHGKIIRAWSGAEER